MPAYRYSEAADLLGVSDDTVRRWGDQGRFTPSRTPSGAAAVDGHDLAALAVALADGDETSRSRARSARNQFRGIVTKVVADTVMAQVEMCCGPFRVVSLISAEAVRDLGLEVGVVAVAGVKATNVTVEVGP
ncbi:TOBE domain-containing protein [Mumia sp. zg.B53]|uniref:TOBE domain-containing protein n=1 Tax=unclassified Mumia TaxID=2621872 RepID=UPI001C6DDC3F|nr:MULTISPECIES: TOBE domain-containing protein [unclassified Mumia]MBW9206850.1 TOBE domain-containing protein [Mumia sp. zg.B17]MBW9210863.1 TOBE domain-containing protein [Mumia sp. zg.B21]MBW9215428.1 TOBE domain-containing protein [Mumia sp. zg.B53]MDD9349022.1 TOBE domain-containing protein [Mumia sp.]